MTDDHSDTTDDGAERGPATDGQGPNRRALLKTMGVATVFGERPPKARLLADGAAATETNAVPSPPPGTPRRLAARLTEPGRPRYGAAVAVADATAVVGAPPGPRAETPDTGSAILLTRRPDGWTRRTVLTPGDRAAGGAFGTTLATDGATIMVGAPLPAEPNGPHGGSVTVVPVAGGDRTETFVSRDPSGVDRFGAAVALAGDTAVVGAPAAPTERGPRTGEAAVFTRSDGTWTRDATLRPGAAEVDRFGRGVGVDGDTALVGARHTGGEDPTPRGTTVVYRRVSGGWTRQATLSSSQDAREDGFGAAVAIEDDVVLVGAPTENGSQTPDAGAVYAFARSGGGWRRRTRLTAADPTTNGRFGTAVALEDGTAVVGDYGRDGPAVFVRSAGRWCRRATRGGDGHARRPCGVDVALAAGRALVGREGDGTIPEAPAGRVEVYEP